MKKPWAIFFCAIPLLFSSCAIQTRPAGYCLLTQNVPLLKSQYEFQGMGTIGRNHAEEQLSFSPIKNIGIIGNFFQRFGDDQSSNVFEAGIGYYKLLKDSFEIEAFGIYTSSQNRAPSLKENLSQPTVTLFPGGWKEQDTTITHNLIADYDAASFQIEFGKHFKSTELSLCLRYSLLNYSNFNDQCKINYGYHGSKDTTYNLSTRYQSFIAIAPTFKAGGKHVKYCAQLGFHFNLNSTSKSISGTLPYFNTVLFSNALVINIDFAGKNKHVQLTKH